MNTRDVTKRGMLGLDFGASAFRIGVKSVQCQGRWTELSEDDLCVLYALLTKRFGGQTATDESPALELIAAWCAAAIQWTKAQKDNERCGDM